MASEVARPESLSHDAPAPLTNGDREHKLNSNADAFGENAALSKSDTTLDVNVTTDSHPGGPTPVEDVAPGIAPVADFIPKDARTSHPTPPPDEPLATSEANLDAEMTTADEPAKVETLAEPTPLPSSNESSLVRQREDDDEEGEEPVAKRGKFESEAGEETTAADAPPAELAGTEADLPASAPVNALLSGVVHTETGAEDQTTPREPVVESTPETKPSAPPTDTDVQMESQPEQASDVAPTESIDKIESSKEKLAESKGEPDVKPAENQAVSDVLPTPAQLPAAAASAAITAQVPVMAAPAATSKNTYSTKPITKPQQRFLVEKMKNLKKTKNSVAFVNPVDHVALNIPTYPEIVKKPMDLSTMERKLKDERYASVQEFANDFDQIILNARAFNGDNHPVTQAGFSMEAYFRKMMESVPSADQPAPPRAQAKKASPKPPTHAATRREPQFAAANNALPPPGLKASASASSAGEAFALQADGTPQIRRDSTINRPARAIKPPPARELPYSKPKRKEHQLELKFCDHILSQLKGAKYSRQNIVFLQPVDPVALNIPQYRQVVKHPMDLSTMSQKLKNGEYGKASEFKKDFELMIENCLAFNPHGNPVRDLGIEFRREFEALWNSKDKWEKAQKNAQRGTSASGDEESAEEEEEEEEDDGGDDEKSAIIRQLQKQLVEMQSAMTGLIKHPKQKKTKAAKTSTKKVAPAPKVKPATKAKAPKKAKMVTYEEKQEISEAVSRMNEEQVGELTRIITENCKKYADQEEMELEIDDLPNDVQAMLLKYVRSIFGNPTRAARAASPDDMAAMDDDDFEPERGPRRGGGGGGAKRKKHKPMGKEEQQAAINNIQKKLSQFQTMGGSASQSPVDQADTSGDDESEESEEE